MKEEDNILRQVGTENPFRVPEGYFEHLTSDIMSRLPEKESVMPPTRPVSLWDKIKPWIYMAAIQYQMKWTKKWNTSTWPWITPCWMIIHFTYI